LVENGGRMTSINNLKNTQIAQGLLNELEKSKTNLMLRIYNEKGPVLAFKVSPDEKILVLGGYEHVLIKEP
jgi:hypothetical protein